MATKTCLAEAGKATRFQSGTEAAVKAGRKGGKASGARRRMLKTFMELDAESTTNDERQTMFDALKSRAKAGDTKALKLYCDIVGLVTQKEKISVSVINNPYASLSDEELRKLAAEDG